MLKMIKLKKLTRRKVLYIVLGVLIFIYALTVQMPLVYMLINSLKRTDEFLEKSAWTLPTSLNFANYVNAFSIGGKTPFVTMFTNSLIFTCASVLISTGTATIVAYVLARFDFPLKNFLVALGVGAMFIPDLGSQSTTYKILYDLYIMDTWFILIKNASPYGLTFLMVYGMFTSVAKSYTEAAELDGAGDLVIFTKIVLPMAVGMVTAMMIINWIAVWNDYYTPYMYLPSIKMLSVGLQELSLTLSQFQRPTLFAAMVVGMAPVAILFLIFNKQIIKSVAIGGLKG